MSELTINEEIRAEKAGYTHDLPYSLVVCTYTPYMCSSITYNVAISESIASFIRRNKTDAGVSFLINFRIDLSRDDYLTLMLHNNPEKDGCYLNLHRRDWRKV